MQRLANIILLLMFYTGALDINGSCEDEYMVQIDSKSVESLKSRSKMFGLKFIRKIVSNIYLFEGDAKTDIEEFKKVFARQVFAVEPREYSKIRFISWIVDSQAPPGFLQWVLTRRPSQKLEMTWPYYGMDIQEAWSMSMTGQGILVAVVDIGVDLTHADLQRNINKEKSRSFVEGDTSHGQVERLRFYQETDDFLSHGTKAAGLIAAEFGNGICDAGVAFNATLISLKVFDEKMILTGILTFPDDYITQALEYRRSEIDIYSCSFGLANMFAKSTNHIRTVMQDGVTLGRNGKGSVYIFAAGNLGEVYDCNTVPYSNSIYTITIASVGKEGRKPKYAMPCSCVLAATYGEYSTFKGLRKLNTTTFDNKCSLFTGTSASAAIASGILALVLQANKDLTWRDIQHIVVRSTSFDRIKYHNRTTRNGKDLYYNPYFGFGLMNATAAVLLARNWTTVPEQLNYTVINCEKISETQKSKRVVLFPWSLCPGYLEHVSVYIQYSIAARIEKNLQISLLSPSGTRSVLLSTKVNRSIDDQNIIDRKWNFTSVQFWGENPYGVWTLHLKLFGLQNDLSNSSYRFSFTSASFTFFGTAANPYTRNLDDHENINDANLETDVECRQPIEENENKKVKKHNGVDAHTVTQNKIYSIFAYFLPGLLVASFLC